MGQLIHETPAESREMLPEGESLISYVERLGQSYARWYSYALGRYRQRLAANKGVTAEELHEGVGMHESATAAEAPEVQTS